MVQCHLCQSWLHEDCAGVHEPPVGLWTCQQCRRLPSMVSDIAACMSQLRDTNIELRDMAREQQRELAAMGRQLTVLMDSHYAPVSPTDSGRCDVDGFTAVTAVTRSTADTAAKARPAPTSRSPAAASARPAPTSTSPAAASARPAPISRSPAAASARPAPTSRSPAAASARPALTSRSSAAANGRSIIRAGVTFSECSHPGGGRCEACGPICSRCRYVAREGCRQPLGRTRCRCDGIHVPRTRVATYPEVRD